MDLAGQEIVNSARAVVYATAAGLPVTCEPCDTVPEAVGDNPYYGVVEDAAPWYDPSIKESADFLGVLGLGVTGFGSAPVSRTPTALIGDGSALGPLRRPHREVVFSVALLASSELGLSYGLAWLAAALRGGSCGSLVCSGDEMCLFAVCPNDTADPDGVGTGELRHLFDVGLLDGPTTNALKTLGGGQFHIAEVTFTVACAKPWIYREPLLTADDWTPLAEGSVVRFNPDDVYKQCLPPTACLTDPTCPTPPLPPLPPVPVSPCYPTGTDNFRRTVLQLDALDAPAWLELVPLLEINTGNHVMRKLTVRFWANPQNLPCDRVTDPCSACLDISVSYLPAGSIFTLDARVQRAAVNCPSASGTATSVPTVYGPQGSMFDWPVFTCPTGLCVEVLTQYTNTAVNAQARVSLVPRQDAA